MEFWHSGLTTFLFRDGLERVFDWIDEITGTARPLSDMHENPGARIDVEMSPRTERLIRRFYRADDLLISQIEKAGAVRAAPGRLSRAAAGATRRRTVSAK